MSITMNHPLLAFINSPAQLIVVAVLVLILFGAKKLPMFARSLGRSMGEFKRARDEFQEELHSAMDDPAKKTPSPAIEPAKTVETAAAVPAQNVPVGSAKAD